LPGGFFYQKCNECIDIIATFSYIPSQKSIIPLVMPATELLAQNLLWIMCSSNNSGALLQKNRLHLPMKYSSALLVLILVLAPICCSADMIIGGDKLYVVQQGDCLISIGAKLGVGWGNIAQQNCVDVNEKLQIGDQLDVNTRRIVPRIVSDGIVINIPEGMLYFFKHGNLTALPVGLGKSDKKWHTPMGKFRITDKAKDPTWRVPASIQEEMKEKGLEVERIKEPGPDNPLGRFALKTSLAEILIHETIWPTTVHQWRSHGCIRMLPEHMEKFFEQVEIGTAGQLIYEPVKIASTGEGRIFLEVHRDIYKMVMPLDEEVKKRIEKRNLSDKVDWKKINMVVNQQSGIAEDITL
jgi:L,D-transpeptidase ErfK/SrfK